MRSWLGAGLGVAAALAAASCTRGESASAARNQPVALFTSLPILWHETGDLREFLHSGRPEHWALATLRASGELRAINTLAAQPPPLAGIGLLVMAQPRALLPQENVALDDWARRGGHVLLFADPLLTGDSQFSLGDRRRPQDVVLLSPILARWGLRLEFDEAQVAGEHPAALLGTALPVNLPGRLAVSGPGNKCRILPQGIAAQCRIGRGRALIVADAALFEPANGSEAERRREILHKLIHSAIQY